MPAGNELSYGGGGESPQNDQGEHSFSPPAVEALHSGLHHLTPNEATERVIKNHIISVTDPPIDPLQFAFRAKCSP